MQMSYTIKRKYSWYRFSIIFPNCPMSKSANHDDAKWNTDMQKEAMFLIGNIFCADYTPREMRFFDKFEEIKIRNH